MSSTTNSPSPSSEPIDISTPPPSESPPPLPCAPPMLLSHIQEGPSVLTLKERIGLSEEGAPALTLEQTMAIEAIVDAPLPILTREQIEECLAELVERAQDADLNLMTMTTPNLFLPTSQSMTAASLTIVTMVNAFI
ncbi:hypothetical protein EI94DRAFT_1810535 [Lactarius quietus]|nr:hypothetical protein EI94DRAFT_1810535 [Lactarius quietus]